MQVVVSGRHMEVTDALHEHATTNANKACGNLFPPPINCKVTLGIESHKNKAEMAVHFHGRDFFAHGESPNDMYAAIDIAAGKLRRQLRDQSGKEQDAR